MNLHYLPDINFWLALNVPSHAHHARVMEWAGNNTAFTLYFCRYTQQGLLRLSTTAAVTSIYGEKPLTNRTALKRMGELLDDPRVHFAPEPADLYTQWSALADVSTSSPKLWMDAYLAAFAMAGGFRLITIDKGFKQFKGLNALVL